MKAVIVTEKAIYNVEMLFSWLLVVGEHCNIDIADVFQFKLSPVPPTLIDEYGCLHLSLPMSLSRYHLSQMPDTFCTISSGPSSGLQETWLQASAPHCQLSSCFQEKCSVRRFEQEAPSCGKQKTKRGTPTEARNSVVVGPSNAPPSDAVICSCTAEGTAMQWHTLTCNSIGLPCTAGAREETYCIVVYQQAGGYGRLRRGARLTKYTLYMLVIYACVTQRLTNKCIAYTNVHNT